MQSIETLKDMAVAYKLALAYDYCPDSRESVDEKQFGKIKKSILDAYQGLRPDEISRLLVDHILTDL